MILRKPYALFIKYFRFLHAVLSFLIFLLFMCSVSLYNFFRIYSVDFRSAMTDYSSSKYLNIINFIELFLIIAILIMVFAVMIYKDKPKKVYIYSLITYLYVIIFYFLCNSLLMRLSSSYIIDVAMSKAYRDFAMIAAILQLVSFGFALIRAIGFDIKNFDFSSDLQKLDISEKDNEEIEVAVNFDKHLIIRRYRNLLRNFKYFYFEHKFIVNTASIVLIVSISSFIYYSVSKYYVYYNQGQSFDVSDYTVNVQNSYILDNDPSGNKIVETEGENPGAVLVVRFQTKGYLKKQKFNVGLISLRMGEFIYKANSDLAKSVYDIGEAYINQTLTEEFETYILAFEIPASFSKKKMSLRINDSNSFVGDTIGAKNCYVRLEPEDLRGESDEVTSRLTDNVSFGDSIFSSSNMQINSFEIGNKFQLNYKYCLRKDSCYDSVEYIMPKFTGNYFKTLLKLSGSFKIDNKLNIKEIHDMRSFLNNFGFFHYKIKDEWHKKKISSELIKPVFATTKDYFIEIPYEAKDASEVYLSFKIRNKNYKYVLK